MDPLLIEFRDDGSLHDDLFLWIKGYERCCDSYYLAIVDGFLPGGEYGFKTKGVLASLLNRWKDAITEAASSGKAAFLPFGFWDECTECLRCRAEEGDVEITPGWSHREGCAVSPRDPDDYFFGVTDFQASAPAIHLSSEDFLKRIEAARGAALGER
jgi:hypothetical protein